MFKVKGQKSRSQGQMSRSQCKVKYKTATDRLSNLKLGTGIVIKAGKDWSGVGRPPVAMHRNYNIF